MTTEFAQLGLISQLEQTVSDLGYITPTPIQSEIIPLMLEGHDVIGQAQTGVEVCTSVSSLCPRLT